MIALRAVELILLRLLAVTGFLLVGMHTAGEKGWHGFSGSEAPAQQLEAVSAYLAEHIRPAPRDMMRRAGDVLAYVPESSVAFLHPRSGIEKVLGKERYYPLKNTLRRSRDYTTARRCLADALYYEARNQPLLGQAAIADVVFNRMASRAYPDTLCGVVYQKDRKNRCQFTFACDGSMHKRIEARAYARADILAGMMISGPRLPLSGYATHYHAGTINPAWAAALRPTAVIGDHLFYSTPLWP